MKISKSKQELASIISENGGWRDGVEFSAQDADGEVFHYRTKPTINKGSRVWRHHGCTGEGQFRSETLRNWHQTILSREEYFHLYPAPDADGWIEWNGGDAPVDDSTYVDVKLANGLEFKKQFMLTCSWSHDNGEFSVLAYRPHKTEQSLVELCGEVKEENKHEHVDAKPTIEQLAAEYQSKLAIATQAQEEADSHRCGAEVALSKLEVAVKELGFKIEPITAKKEPELVITDWRDLQVGDIIQCVGSWEEEKTDGMQLQVTALEGPNYNGDLPIRVEVPGISCPSTWGINFKFIRRP